ncbi:MAG: HAD family hydrolase [Firmicutes bacterium]|nr:HAD family hydrolase [Bacillota bacterium]
MERNWLLFDLDGTLLRSDKTISPRTLEVLERVRKGGYQIAVVTSRAEQNCMEFLADLHPDALITSAGALVKLNGAYVYQGEFSVERTRQIIDYARKICGDLEITVDTLEKHYWNYKVDPSKWDATWGETIFNDFRDWQKPSLKICLQIFDEAKARQIAQQLPDVDMIRFSEGFWYKLTKKEATKEAAIHRLCEAAKITLDQMIAFGDDLADIRMLQSCGLGIAMGNAIPEVKAAADLVIGTNDEDGIALYLEELLKSKQSH